MPLFGLNIQHILVQKNKHTSVIDGSQTTFELEKPTLAPIDVLTHPIYGASIHFMADPCCLLYIRLCSDFRAATTRLCLSYQVAELCQKNLRNIWRGVSLSVVDRKAFPQVVRRCYLKERWPRLWVFNVDQAVKGRFKEWTARSRGVSEN